MAVRPEHKIEVADSFLLAEAWVDTIGGVTHSELIIRHPEWHDPAWLESLIEDGYTVTKYVREGLTTEPEATTLSEVSQPS